MRKILTLLLIFFWGMLRISAQDFQFSQPLEASMYLNPAFTGSANFKCSSFKDWFDPANIRVSSLMRSQWDNRFFGNYLGIEHTSIGSRWSFGTFVQTDQLTAVKFHNQYLGLLTSYTFSDDDLMLRFGYQFGLGRRFSDWSNYDFADEFNGSGFNVATTVENPAIGQNTNYLDYSSAGINIRKGLLSIGIAGHHLTQPNISIWGGNDKLNRKYSAQIIQGIELLSMKESRRKAQDILYLVATYKNQGNSNQLDLGAFLEISRKMRAHHFQKFSVGSWFRGIPVMAAPDSSIQRDVVVIQGAWQRDLLRISYSYDLPLSKSRVFGASHEVGLSFQYSNGRCREKIPPSPLPCSDKTKVSKTGGVKLVWRALLNIF
jgi:type IX secretion system PorP/SprF family membrane protein